MKIYTKEVTVGDYSFKVAVDRDLVCDCFEKFPKLTKFLFSYAGKGNTNEILSKAVEDGNLRIVLDSADEVKKFVEFAFPKMLKKAGDETNANEVLDYMIENEVDDIFSNAMFEFVCSGFTPETTEKKPKVKFTMQ